MSGKVSTTSPAMQRIVGVIKEFGEVAKADLAALAFVSEHTISRTGYLNTLVAAGLIHIVRYERSPSGPFSPVYRYGPAPVGFEPKNPAKLTPNERSQRWKAKTAYNAFRSAQRRVRGEVRPDPLVVALIGARP